MSSLSYSVKSHSFKKEHALCVLLGLVVGLIIAYVYHAYSSNTSEGLMGRADPAPVTKAPVAPAIQVATMGPIASAPKATPGKAIVASAAQNTANLVNRR